MKIFHNGSPKKFVIDPHNMTKLASSSRTGERAKVHASARHQWRNQPSLAAIVLH